MVAISRPEGAGASSSAFFTAIHSGTGASSDGGSRLTASELRTASKNLESANENTRLAAWADVVDVLAEDMDASFLTDVRASLGSTGETVRAQNAYLAHTLRAQIASSDLMEPVRAAAETAAEVLAIRKAITTQVESGKSRKLLLTMLDGTHRSADAAFLGKAWPLCISRSAEGKVVVDADKLDVVATAARAFCAGDGTDAKVDSAVKALAATLGVEAPKASVVLNGHSPEQVQKLLDGAMAKHGTLRMVIDESKVRGAEYRKLVDRIMGRSTVQKVLPMVKEALAKDEETTRMQQAATGGLVLDSESLDLAIGKPYAKKLFEIAQSAGKALGFTKEVTLVITPSTSPNAYVYTADLDNPRVTFFTPMIEKFWDNRTGDFIKLHVDAQGKPCAADAKGARELNIGELLIESVMAHELGHIRGQAILTQAVLIVMFTSLGENLLGGLGAAEQEELKGLMKQARGLLISHGPTGESIVPPHLQKILDNGQLFSKEECAAVIADVVSSVNGQTIAPANIGMDGMKAFAKALYTVSRAEEVSADRYPILLRRDPEYTALMDAVLGLALENNIGDQQKIDSIRGLMEMGPEKFATRMLERLGKVSTLDALSFNAERSHPTNAVRILQDYAFARDKDSFFAEMEKYHALAPDTKLLVAVQLYEKAIAAVEKKAKALEPHEGFKLLEESVQKLKLDAEVREIEVGLKAMLAIVDELVGDNGLIKADALFVDRALDFAEKGGSDMADSADLSRLLGHFKSQLKVLLQDPDLTPGERKIGEERLARIEKILD